MLHTQTKTDVAQGVPKKSWISLGIEFSEFG
jgi:hypothetical protein